MLTPETPFPNAGSYALLVDEDATSAPGQVELVRVLESYPPTGATLVSFPLRPNAGGTKRIQLSELIDATPLTGGEGREMVDLGRELRNSRVRGRAAKEARRDALESRARWAPLMLRLLDEAAFHAARRVA